MKSLILLRGLAAVFIASTASVVFGQTTAIQLFGPADVRQSTNGTGYGSNENDFNTKILNLTCPASTPIQATVSSSTDGTGNVLVDNFISLSVTAGSSTTGPADICLGGTVENGNQQNCFTTNYSNKVNGGGQNGADPDSFLPAGGVPPINISSNLQAGPIQAQFGLVDTGGFLAGSSLYLVTNCTAGGVSGPAQVTGNPISSSNPPAQQLTQNFPFNSSNNLQVQFTYDLSQSQANGNLSITNGTAPTTGDTPINPTSFPPYVANTSFATANCMIHTGELYNNLPACKLYTLTCQVGTNPDQSGALCPESTNRDEIFQEVFDGPNFSLPDIIGTGGQTFHQGIGFLEASEGWTGGTCVFDPQSKIAGQLCPQNVLVNFSGPGGFTSTAHGQAPNSTFITVSPVPEDLTTVSVPGQKIPGYWINSRNFQVNFTSTPPSLPPQDNFVAAPIQSLSYGISPASTVPQPPAPVTGDTVLTNPCPGAGTAATVFQPPSQPLSVSQDGQYLLHYFAQDCAGTQELKFTQDSSQSWSTSFYTYPINVDTAFPAVASGPTLSPAPTANGGVASSYLLNQKGVTATYSCTDVGSGIVTCGTSTYAPETNILNTGNITSPINTSTAGSQTFTVNAVDAAGNQTSSSVNYLVVAPSVNLYLLKVAAPRAKHNSTLTYGIAAALLGKQTTTAVTITDPLPAGVTFVSAKATQLTCTNGKCSNTASCSFANNTVTCTSNSLSLLTPIAVQINVTVQAAAGTTIKNTATLSAANPSVSPGHTQSTASTVVY